MRPRWPLPTGLLTALLALSGCATPDAARPEPLACPPVARGTQALGPQAPAPTRLSVARSDVAGRSLPLRAVIYPESARGLRGEPLAVIDQRTPATVDGLAPGRYQVLVFADPGPFGFDVVLEPGRADARVYVVSGGSGHAVAVETRRLAVGPGTTRVDRQILGFGWGPILADPAAETAPSAEAVFAATADRVARALRETGVAPRETPLSQSGQLN